MAKFDATHTIDLLTNDYDGKYLNLFTRIIFEKMKDRSNLLMGFNVLFIRNVDGEIGRVDPISFRNFINGRLKDCMPTEIENPGFIPIKVKWKPINKQDSKDFYKRIFSKHHDDDFDMKLEEYDPKKNNN